MDRKLDARRGPTSTSSPEVPGWQALFADSLAKGAHIVVAEDNKGLLGFVLYEPARQWLEQIAVAPRGFGSGAAQALIARAKEACPEGFSLDVNADNKRALAFYRCEGFVRTGERQQPALRLADRDVALGARGRGESG